MTLSNRQILRNNNLLVQGTEIAEELKMIQALIDTRRDERARIIAELEHAGIFGSAVAWLNTYEGSDAG